MSTTTSEGPAKTALPFAPYEGPEPYIFVSYSHKNWGKVKPILMQLHEQGYRLWWDENIIIGDEWPATIQKHLQKAKCMLLYLSSEAVSSKWVKKEINVAIMREIPVMGTFLVKTELPDALEYQLTDVQMLFYERYENDISYLAKLVLGLPETTKRPESKPIRPPLYARRCSPETDFRWLIEGDEAGLDKYIGTDAVVVIPDTVLGKRVVAISMFAFKEKRELITAVYIPEGIVQVGGFMDCINLEAVHIPASVKEIPCNLFWGCKKLNNVFLPKGITTVATSAFSGCESLTDITIPASVRFFYSSVFAGVIKSNLTFHCPKDSYAEKHANEHGFKVAYID